MKPQTLELFLKAIEAIDAKVAVLEVRATPGPKVVPRAHAILAGVLEETGYRSGWEANSLTPDEHIELLHLVRMEGRRYFRAMAEQTLDEIDELESKAMFGPAKDKVGAFFRGAKKYIRELFVAGVLAFAGPAPMDAAELRALDAEVAEQHAYLRTFEKETVEANRPPDGTFVARAEKYGAAVWGGAQEILRAGAKAERHYSSERRIHQAHDKPCEVCLEEMLKEWQPIGTLRKIGDSPCMMNCHCVFIYGWAESEAKSFAFDSKKYVPCRDARGRFASCTGGGATGAAKPADKPKPGSGGGKKPRKPKKPAKPKEPKPAKPAKEPKPPKEPKKPAEKKPPKENPKPAEKPQAKPEYHKDGFPKKLDHLEKVKDLGGSTGATLMRDPHTGKQYVQKKGASADHLHNENHADNAYRALGVDVAKSRIYDHGGKPVKLAEYIEGKTLKDLAHSDPKAFLAAKVEASKGFAADAVLGNWDVVGMHHDNMLVTSAGKVVRIDNGGALAFRAQGAKKSSSQWNGDVNELKSMRDPAINPSAASVFSGLSGDQIKAQAKSVLAKKDALLKSAPPELKPTLEARLKSLDKVANPQAAAAAVAPAPTLTPKMESWTATPPKDFKQFTKKQEMDAWGEKQFGEWAKGLDHNERAALKQYSGEIFREMNGVLRGTAKDSDFKWGLSREGVEKTAANAAKALARAKTTEDIVGFRGVKDFKTMGFKSLDDLKPGAMIHEKGFSSVSLDVGTAKYFARSIGDKTPNAVVFKVNTPKGSTGAYLNAGELSGLPGEHELLFPPGAKYRVVGRGADVDHLDTKLPVVLLERTH